MSSTELYTPELDPSEDPLWARIEAYEFDSLDPDSSFAAKLARENLWTADYAERVIEEYRRFCYLAVRAPDPVVPSDAVDQVWHMHLGYSHEYWGDWCGKVLRFDLHHAPARSGDGEAQQCRDWYQATLETYERISGERPPADIWPDAALRFGPAGRMRRVDAADYLIVRRPSRGLLWIMQLMLILATLYYLWEGALLTALVIGIAAAGLAIYRDRTDNAWKSKPWRDGDDGGLGTGGCTTRGIS